MKKLLLIAFTLIAILPELFSQAPQAVCYQALAKDELGNSIIESTIGLQVAILKGGPNGSIEWIERHLMTTDSYGVFAIEVGKGQPFGGTQPSFANIDWENGTYWLQIEFDPTGGTSYELLGSTQIISVPYALYAERSNTANHSNTADYATEAGTADTATVALSVAGDNDLDITNELQELVDQNGELFLQNPDGSINGNGVSFDGSSTNELQNIIFQNDSLYLQAPDGSLSEGQSINFPGNNDNDPMNEIQSLIDQNGELFLQNPDGTTNGNGVSFDNSNTNELQSIIFQNDTLYLQTPDGELSSGQSIDFPGNHDNDPENELQSIIFQNDTLYLQNPDGELSSGQSIDFPGNHDNDPENELQSIIFQNDTLYLQNPDGLLNGAGLTVDTSNINELQELTYSAEDGIISISGGNSIELHSEEVPFSAPGASFDFPQGLSGEHIVNFQGIYQVPAGKTFWVTAANSVIKMTGVGQNGTFIHPTAPNMPVFKEQTILEDCMCTGVLIDQSVHIEAVTMDFSVTGSFVVPTGKTLFVKSGIKNDEVGWLVIDGNPMEFLRSNFTRGTRIITVPENSVIEPIPAQINSVLTGYLIDKNF